MSSAETRDRLIAGTLETVLELGVAGVSARAVAARAEVNQALVFYHFGTVDAMLAEACRAATSERAAAYRPRFAEVGSLRELLGLGRELHAAERQAGNVTLLAQMLAASHTNPTLRTATREALGLWTAEIESVLSRVLASGPLNGVLDPAALAHSISAAFVGLELFEAINPTASADAFAELDRLGIILEAFEGLGPVASRAVKAKLGRAMRT